MCFLKCTCPYLHIYQWKFQPNPILFFQVFNNEQHGSQQQQPAQHKTNYLLQFPIKNFMTQRISTISIIPTSFLHLLCFNCCWHFVEEVKKNLLSLITKTFHTNAYWGHNTFINISLLTEDLKYQKQTMRIGKDTLFGIHVHGWYQISKV